MKKIYLICLSSLIVATVEAQFSGSFAPTQWTTSSNGSSLTANIDTTMTPDSLFINGPNDETGLAGSLSYRVIIPADGSLTFGYDVTSLDTAIDADPYEYISWKINSDTLSIVKDSTIGITTFLLMEGDTFTFSVNSSLNDNGIIQAKIYNWTFIEDPLPITGGGLSATMANGDINLQWNTYSETNNRGFEIQRSDNGKEFTVLSFVNSKTKDGKSTREMIYNYIDNIHSSETGKLFYRYRQVDFDNKFSYSNVVQIRMGKTIDAKMSIYPNPSGTSKYITLDNKEPGTIYIFDFRGRQVVQKKTNEQLTKLNIESMMPGSYALNFVGISGISTITRFTVD